MAGKIRVGVVIGGHPYNVPAFHDLFVRMEKSDDLDVYIQDLDNWAASRGDGTYDTYDAFLFYHMNYWGKLSVRDDMDNRITDAVANMGKSGQGFVVLHHALLSFREMPVYSQLCGIEERTIHGFGVDDIPVVVSDTEHPITRGISNWVMNDEYFVVDAPVERSRILLTTDHPKSMKPLAWTNQYRNARVFCYQSGHGPSAYADDNFQTILARGIKWVACRL